jgi:signal transduction histidine kinase
MRDSISRRALVIAAATVLPLLLIIFIWVPNLPARILSTAAALAGLLAAWLVARAYARRINALAAFVDGMLDRGPAGQHLQSGDDELGELARTLSRMAPRVAELVSRLSMELTRREAVLASMTEAVLAVDAQLNVTFCNHSFQQAVGDHHTPEGVP